MPKIKNNCMMFNIFYDLYVKLGLLEDSDSSTISAHIHLDGTLYHIRTSYI